ncbi:MAG TPA: PAS domain-containing protein [Candidatus Limnocylindria bacterium]|nr:PAS domain-containing protein [Candidatus Limnocylindria bacterium]
MPRAAGLDVVFPGDSELARRMRAHDWSATPMGRPERWPPHLRTALGMCLASRVPMVVWWGPDLTMLYNDACIPFLGPAHPHGLGQPGREARAGLWPLIGPMLEDVRATGRAGQSQDVRSFVARTLPAEEVYVRFTCGPILVADGATVDGLFTTCTETTEQVVAGRRLETLQRLAAKATGARTLHDACEGVAAALADAPHDVAFAGLYVVDDAGEARLKAVVGPSEVAAALPPSASAAGRPDEDSPWRLASVLATRRAEDIDLGTLPRPLAGTAWPGEHVRTAVVVPIPAAVEGRLGGLLVAGVSPRRPLDARYRGFYELIAHGIATACTAAHAREADRTRAAVLAELDRAKSVFFSGAGRERRALGRALVDSMGETFYLLDKDWRFTEFNAHSEAQLRTLGKDPATLIGRVLWDEFPSPPAEQAFRRVMRERVAVTDEHYDARLDEWVECRIYPGPEGGIAVFQRYVTERRRADEELRRSEAYLAESERLSHTGSWAWDVASGDLFWSAEHFRIFGADPDLVKPSFPAALRWIHRDDLSRVEAAFHRARAERCDLELDYRIVRPDGATRHIHSLAHPVVDAAGELAQYVGTIIDVTERKRAEDQVKASERRFRLLAETIPHHVWSYLPDGTLDYCNQRLLDYAGLTPDALQRDGARLIHPDDLERLQAVWQQASVEGTPYEIEQRIRGRDGQYRRFLCTAVPVCGDGGEVVQWFGTNTDIEARRQAEEALRRAHAELTHMARVTTMGELAASLAHELNQPLAAIATNGGSALRFLGRASPDLGKAREALTCIRRDAARAGEIIAATRTFLTKSAGERTRFDVNVLVLEVLVVTHAEIRRHGIAVHEELAADLPLITACRIQIQQVVLNLLMNAIEAMAPVRGWRQLVVRSARDTLDGGPAVRLVVQDSGIGFAGSEPGRLFDAFYTTKHEGLGMGLSIARSVIEAHAGRLWAMPNPAGGATFQFLVPAGGERRP